MVGIIIAVIGIALFAIVVVGLYKQSVSQGTENAKRVLNNIIGKIELLEDGQSNEFAIQGFDGGEDWYLLGWSKEDKDRPGKCFFQSCLCICPKAKAEVCQEKGICRKVEKDLVEAYSEQPWRATITGESKGGEAEIIRTKIKKISYIPLSEKLFELGISKKEEGKLQLSRQLDLKYVTQTEFEED